MSTTVRKTHKTCKCGQHIVIRYDESITGVPRSIKAEAGGYFKSGWQWPNYVYCAACQRVHDLTKFKKYMPEISQEAAYELLAALEMFLAQYGSDGSDPEREQRPEIQAARAAIKKAQEG